MENKDKDYSEILPVQGPPLDRLNVEENILHIHGDSDDKVPLDSLGVEFKRKIIVKNGDHDLERPDMIKQWLLGTVSFLRE